MKWAIRQFLDGLAQYPARFAFKNVDTGEVEFIADLAFAYGDFNEVGTPMSRGYWQPIEDFLNNCDIDAVFRATKQEGANLLRYAPITGAAFINPRAEASPSATDNSTRIATTAQVRAFVGQYQFPAKNVIGLSASQTAYDTYNSANIKWKDSADFTFDDMLLSVWKGTKLVYRTDRFPINEADGIVLVDNQVRDQIFNNPIEITTDDLMLPRFYCQVFPYTSSGIYNRNTGNRISISLSHYEHDALAAVSGSTRHNLAAATDGAGNVLFGGGGDVTAYVDRYSSNGAKTTLASLSAARTYLAAATNGRGNVLFAGGQNSQATPLNVVDRYTPSGARTTLAPLHVARTALAGAASTSTGAVFFAGGLGASDPYLSSDVDIYESNDSHHYSEMQFYPGPLSQARYFLAAATDGAGNVLFGGEGNGDAVDRYKYIKA